MQTVTLPFRAVYPMKKHLGILKSSILKKYGTYEPQLLTRDGENAIALGWNIPILRGIPTERDQRPPTAFNVLMSFPQKHVEKIREQILDNPHIVKSIVKKIFPYHFKALENALAYNNSQAVENLPLYLIDNLKITIDDRTIRDYLPKTKVTATIFNHLNPSERIDLTGEN